MKQQQTVRYTPDVNVGLTAEQVKQRTQQKLTNKVKKVVGKSYLQIFVGNICTFFNLLGFIIFGLMLLCKSPTNMMFIVIILANTVIGIFQEIRSKLAVEKLAIVSEPTVEVVRDGAKQTISTQKIVLDEIVAYSAGRQICCDGVLAEGELEVDESMLTGESDSVKKRVGDRLFSGSYVISGSCLARCDKVGKDNYIEQLSARVKKAKMPDSQLMKGIRIIIKFISIIIFPLGIASFLSSTQIRTLIEADVNILNSYVGQAVLNINGQMVDVVKWVNIAIESMSGSMIGMVPSGMVLLTSVALAVAALKLSRKKVLVRELPCIEMLARVDTLCLDKTGTITDGTMTVQQIIPTATGYDVQQLVASLVNATGDDNSTAKAIKNHLVDQTLLPCSATVPFSSARKYSAATLQGVGTVALGAAEFMFDTLPQDFSDQCNALLKQGLRVLAVGVSKEDIANDKVCNLVPIAIIALADTVRSDAPEIIKWFMDNDVAVKVISGDNPLSVSVIAQRVGIVDAEKYISLEGLTDDQVAEAANQYTVFGRVTPEQKAILVRSMKKAGRTVAMTGDGVNDILAMKESDCAISVGCGSDAAKTVANLVLTDNKFSSMPQVVAEGRQVVNNVQNSASLFLMKTSMTVLTTILCLILQRTYPFVPKHLYAMEFFIVGIASFLCTLKPNRNLITGKFLVNTLKSTLPSGVAMFLSVAMCYAFSGVLNLSDEQLTTVAMFSMTGTGLLALAILLYPYDKFNAVVGAVVLVGTVGCYLLFPTLLGIVSKIFGETDPKPMYVSIDANAIIFTVVNAIVMGALILGIKWLMKHIARKQKQNV